MSRKKLFIYILLLIITRFFDGYTTYLVTPDLSNEYNPIIRIFSGNWILLSLLGALFTGAVIAMLMYAHKYQTLLLQESKGLVEHLGMIMYNKKTPFYAFFYRISYKKSFLVFLIFSFSISLVYYSIFLIINNIFILSTYYYSTCFEIYKIIYNYHLLIIVLSAIVIYSIVSVVIIKKSYLSTIK